MNKKELLAAHSAAKIIETDGISGYYSCVERFGKEIANALLVLFLRNHHNPHNMYPMPDNLVEEVNKTLIEYGILAINDPRELVHRLLDVSHISLLKIARELNLYNKNDENLPPLHFLGKLLQQASEQKKLPELSKLVANYEI